MSSSLGSQLTEVRRGGSADLASAKPIGTDLAVPRKHNHPAGMAWI